MKEGENERGGEGEKKPRRRMVRRHTDLEVYQRSFAAAMKRVGMLDNVAGFVTQDLHRLALGAALDVLEHLAF